MPTADLAAALPHTWQVTALVESGQIEREIALDPGRPPVTEGVPVPIEGHHVPLDH